MGKVVALWKNVKKCLALGSLIIGGVATGLPEVYAKIAFAIALGLSNAAIYLSREESDAKPQETG